MQLPAFISRLAGFADKAEAQLDQIAKSNSEITALRAQVETLTADISAAHAKYKAEISAETDKATTLAKEVETLKAQIEKEKSKTTEAIAAQGLPLDRLPETTPDTTTAASSKPMNLTEECLAIRRKQSAKL